MVRDLRPARSSLGRAPIAVVLLALLGIAAASTAPPSAALDPGIPAPATRLSADGRTATDGQRSLTVSTVKGFDGNGATVEVSGTGYDTFKGIYVAFCVVPPTNQPPTPCGGGADMTGSSGASHWISSNPPPQGVGLAAPYGPGGSFRVTLAVQATIGPPGGTPVDCRRVRCAIVTRNDHTRSSDRGQDIFVPLSFAATSGGGPGVTPTTAPATPTTPAPTFAPVTEAPATLSAPTTEASVTATTGVDGQALDDEQAIAETSAATGGTDGSGPWPFVAGAVVLIAAAGVGIGLFVRRRGQAAP